MQLVEHQLRVLRAFLTYRDPAGMSRRRRLPALDLGPVPSRRSLNGLLWALRRLVVDLAVVRRFLSPCRVFEVRNLLFVGDLAFGVTLRCRGAFIGPPAKPITANIRNTREQEQAIGETKRRALAVDVAPRQLARLPRQQRQGAPDLAFEMKHPVKEVVEEGRERAVNVGVLAALLAVRAGKLGAAVEAVRLVRVAVAPASPAFGSTARGRGFRRSPRPQALRDSPSLPLAATLGALPRPC